MNTDTDTGKKAFALVVILCGVAYVVYRNRATIRKFIKQYFKKNSGKNFVLVNAAMTDVCNAFITYASNFQGIFEPMFKASQGIISQERKYNTLLEWNIRMNNIKKAPACLKGWWATIIADKETLSDEELQRRASMVMKMLEASGIIRDDRQTLVAMTDTAMYYQNLDNVSWNVGQELRIESPCWYMQCSPVRILEKGYCEII